ncbi:MAG: hypothetical protein WD757_09895 [Actinomycetota bacterium]
MRRIFWLALGLGAGATGAVMASRWMKRQTQKMAPSHIARSAGENLVDLSKKVAESMQEGRRAMEDREREIRENARLD